MPTPRGSDRPSLPLDANGLLGLLHALGVEVDIDATRARRPEQLVLKLAYGLVGAAERHAIIADETARAAGLSMAELGEAAGDLYAGAACHTELDALSLVQWRLTRTTQALQQRQLLEGPAGGPDPLGRTILLVAAALSGLLAAAVTMRNPLRGEGDTAATAHAVRQAIAALDQAAQDARGQRVLADLLTLTD
jgi:hypothetical protein